MNDSADDSKSLLAAPGRGGVGSRSVRGAAIIGLLLVALAFGCWLALEIWRAKSSLQAVRDSLVSAKNALANGSVADAAKLADDAQSGAEAARDATHSLPWVAMAAVPSVGGSFLTVQQISDVVLGLVSDVIRPSLNVGRGMAPNELLDDSGRIDVQALREAAPQLAQIAAAAAKLDDQAQGIAEPAQVSSVREARAALQSQTADASRLLARLAVATRLAPSMMGVDGLRTYFVGFQTNAEARGTGGLLGGFGILQFDNGRPSVDELGSNAELKAPRHPIDLGPEYMAQYGSIKPTTDYRNSNLSPHFPYAAQIWKSMWEQQSGTHINGVVSIDPVAASYILGATGPITLPDGENVTQDNIVSLTESTAYIRYADDNDARKRYLQEIAGEVVKKMTGQVKSPRTLLDALMRAAKEGRIAVWSESPPEEGLLENTPLAHTVPDDASPYAAVVVNNIGGNKLDYYLTRQIEYKADACVTAFRRSTVIVRLTNNAPALPLPDYVAGSEGLATGPSYELPPPGTNTALVALFATRNAKVVGAFVDGEPAESFGKVERGHPIFELELAIMRGETTEVRFELDEPSSPGPARVPTQPLIDNVTPSVSVPECRG